MYIYIYIYTYTYYVLKTDPILSETESRLRKTHNAELAGVQQTSHIHNTEIHTSSKRDKQARSAKAKEFMEWQLERAQKPTTKLEQATQQDTVSQSL